MVKLIKILWNDFRGTDIASLVFEAFKVLAFILLAGCVTYFVLFLFGVVDLVSLSILNWFFAFLLLGCIVVTAFGMFVIVLYILAFIASAFYDAFSRLPEYFESVKERMHE